MITLLNLQGLYNTHVRPYAANQDDGGSDEEAGQTGNKRRRIKIEKGYQHLLPDCIGQSRLVKIGMALMEDPVPAGDKSGVALLPLLGDFGNPPGPGPELPEGPLEMLGMDVFQSARLEPGTQKGVSCLSLLIAKSWWVVSTRWKSWSQRSRSKTTSTSNNPYFTDK
jgi:hypothetical protein